MSYYQSEVYLKACCFQKYLRTYAQEEQKDLTAIVRVIICFNRLVTAFLYLQNYHLGISLVLPVDLVSF